MRLNPSQASPGRGPGSVQENWWKLQTFAWPISLHDPSCGSQTSYDPSFQHLHQATFLWPGTQVQLASMSSCEPTYFGHSGVGGLAASRLASLDFGVENSKSQKTVPSAIFGFVSEHLQNSATLEQTLELAATSLLHCVSTRIIGTTRASTAKGDPTIRNFETSKHWDHKPTRTLWRTMASFRIIGETMQVLRVPKIASPKATHTHTQSRLWVYPDRKGFSVNLSHYSEGGPATAFWMCLGNQK